MNNPYLIQRGKISPLNKFTGIDSLISFDYMGSAEFEYGALPKALKQICSNISQLITKELPIKYKNKNLWLLCKQDDILPLEDFWNKVVTKNLTIRLKELLYYGDNIGDDGINFWWDIENCWMAALGNIEIAKVLLALDVVTQRNKW